MFSAIAANVSFRQFRWTAEIGTRPAPSHDVFSRVVATRKPCTNLHNFCVLLNKTKGQAGVGAQLGGGDFCSSSTNSGVPNRCRRPILAALIERNKSVDYARVGTASAAGR